MRLKARQTRFLAATLACWIGTRVYVLWPGGGSPRPPATAPSGRVDDAGGGLPRMIAEPAFQPWRGTIGASAVAGFVRPITGADGWRWDRQDREARMLLLGLGDVEAASAVRVLRRATFASEPAAGEPPREVPGTRETTVPAALFPTTRARAGDLEAQAYVFVRPGGTRPSLAGGGELGGSQVAARLAWRPRGGALGLAARVYAPLRHDGAEAAVGIDWHPAPVLPLRLSIERRQRLDGAGRSAWSAYAAGGFYRGGAPGALEFDGYAQAGVVGARRRDGFVDGALRLGYRLPARHVVPVMGVGLWGAAQPGVSRIDIGPRASLRLPLAGHVMTVALDGRFRLAGQARPGSGAALTVAADF